MIKINEQTKGWWRRFIPTSRIYHVDPVVFSTIFQYPILMKNCDIPSVLFDLSIAVASSLVRTRGVLVGFADPEVVVI
jgi:hypothetical protein